MKKTTIIPIVVILVLLIVIGGLISSNIRLRSMITPHVQKNIFSRKEIKAEREAKLEKQIGRYQMFFSSFPGQGSFLVDTATGRIWQGVRDPETNRLWFAAKTVETLVLSPEDGEKEWKKLKEEDWMKEIMKTNPDVATEWMFKYTGYKPLEE